MSIAGKDARWFVRSTRSEPAVRIFGLPYAGGGASLFRGWSELLPRDVEMVAVLLPGRESRMLEESYRDVDALVRDLVDVLESELRKPYGLFGHSLGALLAFESAREVMRRGWQPPGHLWASGFRAPQLPRRERRISGLPDHEFVDEIRGLEGTPPGVLENAELMELVLPGLRADFELWERYEYTDAEPLACPITACGGRDDEEVSPTDLRAWSAHTSSTFELRLFEGGHFFVVSAVEGVIATVREDLEAMR